MRTKIIDKMKSLACLLLAACSFNACVEDEIKVLPEAGDETYVQITLNPRAAMPSLADDFESGIATLRILIVDADDKLEQNLYIDSPGNAGRIDNPVVKLTDGKKYIYVVANESAAAEPLRLSEMTVGTIGLKHTLENKIFTNMVPTTDSTIHANNRGILMGGVDSTEVVRGYSALNPQKVQVMVERTVAKITLNVQRAKEYAAKPDEKLIIQKISVYNYRDKEYLFAKNRTPNYPTGSDLIKIQEVILNNDFSVDSIQHADGTANYNKLFDFYTPSNKTELNGTPTPSFIEIVYKKGEREAKTDTVHIVSSKGDMLRNNHYTLNLTISPTQDNLEVDISVLPWNEVELVEKPGIAMGQIEITFPMSVEYNISEDGGDVEVVVRGSSVAGWYAVLRKIPEGGEGKIIQKSTPTTEVKPLQEMKGLKIDPITDLSAEYLVHVYHPIYAPEQANNPIAALNSAQYGGVIYRTKLELEGNRWPEGRLPGKGLQISKKGNVHPDHPVLNSETEIKWTTVGNTFTTSGGLGMGKSNTATLRSAGGNLAVEACIQLGPEWYLPSTDEMRLFQNHENELGESYSFESGIYWTSVDVDPDHCYGIDYSGNNPILSHKRDASNYIRCVREIN